MFHLEQLGGTEKLDKMVSEIITEAPRVFQGTRLDPRAPGSTCTAVEGALQDGDRDLFPQGTPNGHCAVPALHSCHVDDARGIEEEVSTHTWAVKTGEKNTQKEVQENYSLCGTMNR